MTGIVVSSLPHQIDLEQLARQARAGCPVSFDELTRRVSPALLAFLRKRSTTIQDAEDLRQETLLKAYQNLQRYDPGRPFGPWLMTIAARLAAGRARSSRSAQPLTEEATAGRAERNVATDQREFGELLWKSAAQALPSAQYHALRLRYAEQMSVHDMAGTMGISEANVKVLLFRARKKLMGMPQVRALLCLRIGGEEVGDAM